MGRVKDKLIELEEAGVIFYSNEINTWSLMEDLVEPQPFDLAEYLFQLHRGEQS